MLQTNKFLLMLALLLGSALVTTGCPTGGGDDDDSAAGDDDDSAAGDDDDSAAGDDDDSAAGPDPLVMDLTYLDVFCESDPALARGATQAGDYIVTVEFEGYADDVWFWMWDGYQSSNAHFMDEAAPWALANLDYSDEDSQWDIWGIGGEGEDADGNAIPPLGIWQSIGDANTNGGTILDCYDANSNPNVEVHNYMVCATDWNDETNAQCYFCGEDLGNDVFWMGAVADNTAYQVGLWTDPTDDSIVYQVTTDVTNDPEACTLDSEIVTD